MAEKESLWSVMKPSHDADDAGGRAMAYPWMGTRMRGEVATY